MRKNQLSTAAPRDKSTLSWTPRANALAKRTCRHQEPRTVPVKVVRHAGVRGSLIDPGSSKKRTICTHYYVVLALIFPSQHKPLSPLHQKWAPLRSIVVL